MTTTPANEEGVRRTVLTAKILVESKDLTEFEHERTVLWAASQVKEAPKFSRNAFVAVGVYNEEGQSIGFAGHGSQASTETKEIVADIFEAV